MSQMNHDDISMLLTKSKQAGVEQLFYKMCVKIYSRSSSFNAAYYRFTTFIRPYLSEFNKDTIIDLIRTTNQNHINGNNQTCARNAAQKDHLEVLQAFMQIGGIKEEICEHLGVYDRSAVFSMPELFWVDAGLPGLDKVTVVKEGKKKSNG